MNGNPNAAQKRFHNELRDMYSHTKIQHGIGELHHIFGSKAKFKLLKEAGVKKPGEWFVIMIPKKVHDDIDHYTFDDERNMFLQQKEDYEKYYEKDCPIPEECYTYYNAMLSKQHILKNWPL